jgi:hypothetical protein
MKNLDDPVTLDEIYGTISDKERYFWNVLFVISLIIAGVVLCIK